MTLWPHSLLQQVDHNGAPDRWSVAFLVAGTSRKATAYKDPEFASPHQPDILADVAGRLPVIHLKPDGVKLDVRITYEDGRTKLIPGFDPGSPAVGDATTATPRTPVSTKSGVVISLTASDAGKVIPVTTAVGANATVFLPKGADLTDGITLTLINDGGGVLIVRGQGTTLIDRIVAIVLTNDQEAVTVVWDGAGFRTVARTPSPRKRILVRSRKLTNPPSVANPGDTYIAGATANGWTINYLMTANGAGSWIQRKPEVGDTAVIENETVTTAASVSNIEVTWSGTEWVESSRRTSQIMVVKDEYTSSTGSLAAHGGTQPTAGFWTRNKLNALSDNSITGAVLASDVITLPKGQYRVTARRRLKGAITGKLAFRAVSTTSKAIKGMPLYLAANEQGEINCDGRIQVTADTESFELVFVLAGTVAATTLGDASAIAGETEVYAEVIIQTLSAT